MNEFNRSITLARRPEGEPLAADFAMLEAPIPEPGDSEVLCKTIYLSLDPYMRGRMSAARSYVEPLAIGDVINGATVSQVVKSRHPDYSEGEFVSSYHGWQEWGLAQGGSGLPKIDPGAAPLSTALGVLGMPGLTAYAGLLDIGRPQQGETVVVAAATGAVGSVVGQIAKIKGCRTVGIAGSPEKCAFAVDKLGFDACLNHRSADLAEQLTASCPEGIDVYFENVGGPVFDAVVDLLNREARIPVCGLIAHYNDTELPAGPNLVPKLMRRVLVQRLKIQGFIVTDFQHRYRDFVRDVGGWVNSGELTYREDIVTGLENAVEAFTRLLTGGNFGKLLVQVASDPTRPAGGTT